MNSGIIKRYQHKRLLLKKLVLRGVKMNSYPHNTSSQNTPKNDHENILLNESTPGTVAFKAKQNILNENLYIQQKNYLVERQSFYQYFYKKMQEYIELAKALKSLHENEIADFQKRYNEDLLNSASAAKRQQMLLEKERLENLLKTLQDLERKIQLLSEMLKDVKQQIALIDTKQNEIYYALCMYKRNLIESLGLSQPFKQNFLNYLDNEIISKLANGELKADDANEFIDKVNVIINNYIQSLDPNKFDMDKAIRTSNEKFIFTEKERKSSGFVASNIELSTTMKKDKGKFLQTEEILLQELISATSQANYLKNLKGVDLSIHNHQEASQLFEVTNANIASNIANIGKTLSNNIHFPEDSSASITKPPEKKGKSIDQKVAASDNKSPENNNTEPPIKPSSEPASTTTSITEQLLSANLPPSEPATSPSIDNISDNKNSEIDLNSLAKGFADFDNNFFSDLNLIDIQSEPEQNQLPDNAQAPHPANQSPPELDNKKDEPDNSNEDEKRGPRPSF